MGGGGGMNIYFFTVMWKGEKYRAMAPFYSLKKAAEYIGVPVSRIYRGAAASFPAWDKSVMEGDK